MRRKPSPRSPSIQVLEIAVAPAPGCPPASSRRPLALRLAPWPPPHPLPDHRRRHRLPRLPRRLLRRPELPHRRSRRGQNRSPPPHRLRPRLRHLPALRPAQRERLAFLFKIVDRARDATRAVTPILKDESLSALVREAHAHLVDRLGDRASCLDMTIDVALSLRARVDRAAILQALQNLLQNGAEAHPVSAARITISVTARTLRAGSQVEIVVRDGGEGMNDEQRATLFTPFGSSKPGGTGLGLVVVRSMIEEVHGGTMAIESARGEGTSVTMLLPTGRAAA